jgi:cystathionine gamma-synthase
MRSIILTNLQLSQLVQDSMSKVDELCLLLQSERMADECCDFLARQSAAGDEASVPVRAIQIPIYGPMCKVALGQRKEGEVSLATLNAVFFPATYFPLAKKFRAHTGMSITSRFAEHCLAILFPHEDKATTMPWTPLHTDPSPLHLEPLGGVHQLQNSLTDGCMIRDGEHAKRVVRQRIAELERGDAGIEGTDVSEDDIYLFPTGMQALFSANSLVRAFRPEAKSVCFGYLSFHLQGKQQPNLPVP